jgi:DegV family protein with EDD domain
MQLVTDRAADLSQQQIDNIPVDIHYLPLTLTLSGKSYISGVDIQPEGFYDLLYATDDMPTTSLPSPGEVEQIYRDIAEKTGDNELLSVHIASGLSGTLNSVKLAAQAVEKDGIKVHVIDTRTLAPAEGWQVEAAGHAIKAGWSVEQITAHLDKIHNASNSVFTLPDLKYLIHGGRIGHMKGLIASTLGIKPLIGVSKGDGTYEQRGQVRTFKRAVKGLADSIAKIYPEGAKLRVQPVHALSSDSVEIMKAALNQKFDVTYMPTVPMAPVLGAHTGIGMVGCAFGDAEALPSLPA